VSAVPPMSRSLTMLIHGNSKTGKSTLAITAPYPRLLLDVEMGYKFLPIRPVFWDPLQEDPPIADGTWDTCVVIVRDYDTVLRVYQYMQLGRHQFASLIIDSISELQVKLFENLVGRGSMQMQQWGDVLRHLGGLLRDLRDLTVHQTKPLEAVILTAMSKENQQGVMAPYLQGQLSVQVPYFYDVLGALAVEEWPNQDPMQPPYKLRRLYVERTNKYEAGERVQGRLGAIVEQSDLSVERMMEMIYGPRVPVVAAVPAEAAS
jgi:hypothetical protein